MSEYGLKNGYGVLGVKQYAGNQINPYAINDLEDLQSISADNWDTNTYYEQTANITLTTPINHNDFEGHYDLNGYTNSGATLTLAGIEYMIPDSPKHKLRGSKLHAKIDGVWTI